MIKKRFSMWSDGWMVKALGHGWEGEGVTKKEGS